MKKKINDLLITTAAILLLLMVISGLIFGFDYLKFISPKLYSIIITTIAAVLFLSGLKNPKFFPLPKYKWKYMAKYTGWDRVRIYMLVFCALVILIGILEIFGIISYT